MMFSTTLASMKWRTLGFFCTFSSGRFHSLISGGVSPHPSTLQMRFDRTCVEYYTKRDCKLVSVECSIGRGCYVSFPVPDLASIY